MEKHIIPIHAQTSINEVLKRYIESARPDERPGYVNKTFAFRAWIYGADLARSLDPEQMKKMISLVNRMNLSEDDQSLLMAAIGHITDPPCE